jgi:Alkylmercury lyase
MASLQIKTADELGAGDLEERWRTRRAGRETAVSRHVLQLFVERGGPIPVEDVVAGFPDLPPEAIRQALVKLDDDDLIRIQDGHVDMAYPFSALPTSWMVRLPGGQERFACCAVDALGIAPMLGRPVEIRSRCHHCGEPLALESTPEGARPEGSGIMLWIGQRTDARCKVADSL